MKLEYSGTIYQKDGVIMKLQIQQWEENKEPQWGEVWFLPQKEQKEDRFFGTQEEKGWLEELLQPGSFSGKAGEVETLRLVQDGAIQTLLLAGLGKKEKLEPEVYRKTLAKICKEAERIKLPAIYVDLSTFTGFRNLRHASRILAETCKLSAYRFHKYLTKEEEDKGEYLLTVYVKGADAGGIAEGEMLAESTLLARDLVNEPANILTPKKLAKAAMETGEEAGFAVEILHEEEISALGMEAFLAVARGAGTKPRLIVMRHLNDPEHPEEILGVVGKGLIYDSGGLSIKPTSSMMEMKSDMSGAAAVIGAFQSVARAGLKVNVVGVIAACENMICGKSYRPGDIIRSMSGKTIFIGNTDAEGRLTLADAIHYILEKEKANCVVDVATLTGAAVVALGDQITAVLSNDDGLYEEIAQASHEADEKIWRLPLAEEYREKLKAKEADLTNSAGNPGTITAAMFLEAFVQKKPWVHMDIAGTSWAEKPFDYYSLGGTGYGVRTLYYWLKNKSR